MPIRGESIGTAYVRILADGDGLDDDIERQMRQAEPTFEKAGERNNEAYNRGWNSGLPDDGDDPLESFEEALEHGRGRYNRIGHLLSSDLMDGFEEEVERLFPDVGDRMVANLRDSLAKGDIGEAELINRLHNLRREYSKALQDIANDNAAAFNAMEESVKRYSQGLDNSGRSRRQFLRDISEMIDILPDAVTNTDGFRATITRMRGEVANAAPRLERFKEQLRDTGETIGRFFGKGSRNDFLNFFGSFVAGLTKATRALASFVRWPGLVAEQVGRLVGRFQAAIDEAGSLREAFLNLASQGLPGLIAAAAAVGAVVFTITASIGIFGAAISLVTGLVLALAGSLSYALVGGLVAVSGALFPFAAAIGVAALAMAGLSKKNQGLKDLKKDFQDLQKIAAKGLFGKDGAGLGALSAVLKGVEPIVRTVSTALGGLLTQLGDFAKTKEFTTLMQDLSKILGPMVTQLGQIGGNLTIGLLQLFRDASPLISDFLGWLDKLAKGFRDAGDAGKNAGKQSPLQQFLANASSSAKIVWGLISNVIAIIGDLFKAGKGTGDSALGKMAKKAEELHKWLSDPANKDTIEKWFEDAGKLADKLGEAADQAIKFIGALDTENTRAVLLGLVGALTQVLRLLTWIAKTANGVFDGLVDSGVAVVLWFQRLPAVIRGSLATFKATVKVAFTEMWQGIKDTFDDIKDYITSTSLWNVAGLMVGAFVDVVKGFFQDLYDWLIGNSLIPDLVMGIVGWFARLPGLILTALGNLGSIFLKWVAGVPAAVAGVAEKVVSPFRGLAGKIITGAGDLAGKFGSWVSTLPGKAATNATNIAKAYAGLAGKVISQAGSLAKAIGDWVAGRPAQARSNADNIAKAYSGLASRVVKNAGSLGEAMDTWGQRAVKSANHTANAIVDQFDGLNKRIISAIGPVEIKVKVIIPDIPRPHVTAIVDVPKTAAGGVFGGAQVRMIGEAGPEAVVPLNRPLSQVDPAVRALSAFAQGLSMPNSKSEVDSGDEKKDKAEMNVTIITPTKDPYAVASEVFARFTAASYV